jgi:hypothetical protein
VRISILKEGSHDEIQEIKEVATLQEYAQIITTHNYSPFIFQEPKRLAKNFCGGDCFGLDVDSGLVIDDAVNRLKELNLAAIVAPSRSHQKEKNGVVADRFRIIIPLSEPLIIAKQVKATFFALKKLFPEADDACKDAARLFYRSQSIYWINESGEPFQVPDIIEENAQPQNEVISPQKGVKYPLSRMTMDVIKNGAPKGTRNELVKKIAHDAIQQQWPFEELWELLKTSEHEWLYDSVAYGQIIERYKNFTPTHPPRVPMTPAANGKPQAIPLNKIREVMLNWLESNDVAVSYNRTMYINGVNVIAEDVVRKIIVHLSEYNMAINETLLSYSLQEWIEENRRGHLEAVRDSVDGFDPKGEQEVRRFLAVLSSNVTDLDVKVLQHMVWCTKRRLNNLKTKYEMMLVFTGGQGAGKSHALREFLFKPFGDLAHTSVGFEALSDSRENRLFSDHYIAMFDEMSGAHKADMERVKQIITSGIIKQRRMGTTSHDSLPMNCAFFGTANMPLEMLIKDTTGMRRFWEIVVDPAQETSKRWALLKDIDVNLIWRSADHNNETCPIEANLPELQAKQEEIREKSVFEWLIEENIIQPTQNLDEYTSAIALTQAVNVSLNQNWSSRMLSKEWKKVGLDKRVTSCGVLYGVKIVDLNVLHTLKTKYNMRMPGKDKEGYQF